MFFDEDKTWAIPLFWKLCSRKVRVSSRSVINLGFVHMFSD